MSYDNQNFCGVTPNDLEGRHIFVFFDITSQKEIFNFFATTVRLLKLTVNCFLPRFYYSDFSECDFLSNFFCFTYIHFYVCYRSHIFTRVKYKFQGCFKVHFMCCYMIYFHWREIKSQNVSQTLVQNTEISI